MNVRAAGRARLRRVAVPAIKLALLAAVVGFVAVALHDALARADWSKLFFRPGWIVLGLVLIAGGVVSGALVCQKLYGRLGTKLSVAQGVALLTLPMLGSYLPGRVLTAAGHAAIARAMGVPLAAGGAGVLLLAALGILAAFLVGLALLVAQPIPGIEAAYFRAAMAAALGAALVVLYPRLYFGVVNLLLRALRRRPLRVELGLGSMLQMLLGLCLYVVFFVAGFLAMARGIMPLPLWAAPAMIGAISLATVIGFLALFAPAGIGVREGLLLVFLSPLLGRPAAGVLAISLRLLQVLVDVALAGAGLLLFRRVRGRGPPQGGRITPA